MEHGSHGYPGPRDGQAQKQDPDDDTADGADSIAALRYLVMSHFRTPNLVAASEEVGRKFSQRNDPPTKNYDHGFGVAHNNKMMNRLQAEQGSGSWGWPGW